MKTRTIFVVALAAALGAAPAPALAKASFTVTQCVSGTSFIGALAATLGKLFGTGAVNTGTCDY